MCEARAWRCSLRRVLSLQTPPPPHHQTYATLGSSESRINSMLYSLHLHPLTNNTPPPPTQTVLFYSAFRITIQQFCGCFASFMQISPELILRNDKSVIILLGKWNANLLTRIFHNITLLFKLILVLLSTNYIYRLMFPC